MSKSAWAGRMYSFSVSPDASPELYRELACLPARLRGERLRQLATLGLVLSSIKQDGFSGPVQPPPVPEADPDDTLKRREKLRARFAASVS